MNEMMNPNMMGGNMMMARGQDGSVNLFGDMTIINQHTYAPRQQNPMMQMAQIAQLQMANQNRQMELALEHEKLMLEAKKMDILDRIQLQQNNLLGNGNSEKVLAIGGNDTDTDNISEVDTSVVEDVEFEIRSEDSTSEGKTITLSNKATPIKPNIFKLNINYDNDIDAVVVEEPEPTGESIDTKNKYINLLDYYNTSGKLNDDIFEKIHYSNCGGEYWVYNKDKPSILFYSTFSYRYFDLSILGIVANHLKSPTIGAEEKDAIREHGLLINVFYEFDKSMLLFIKFVETKDYLRILSSSNSNENVEQYYDNYKICKELRNWFEDEIDNLRMCNITKFTLMVQPKYDDGTDFNKNHEIGVEVNLVMLTYPEFIIPIKGFAKTYMEINV